MNPSKFTSSRDAWARRAAAWERTSKDSETSSASYNDALLQAARIDTDQNVLDLAAGMCDPTVAIAERIGLSGHVVALDQSPLMLAGARRRALENALSNIKYVASDMMGLPFADAVFDAVTCRYGLMFPPDRGAAAAEARRVLKPGARAAFVVWGPYEENTVYATVRRTVLNFFGEPGGDKGPVRHIFSPDGSLTEILAAAGFTDVEERPITNSAVVSGDGSVWRNRLERSYFDRIAKLDEAGREDLERALVEAFEPYQKNDGYRVTTHAKIGSGAAPGG